MQEEEKEQEQEVLKQFQSKGLRPPSSHLPIYLGGVIAGDCWLVGCPIKILVH